MKVKNLKMPFATVVIFALLAWPCLVQDNHTKTNSDVSVVVAQSEGLRGYIGFSHDSPPAGSGYNAGMGFYAAVWPVIDQPLADFHNQQEDRLRRYGD